MGIARTGVIGLGLIGGSLARALAADGGPAALCWDVDAGVRELAARETGLQLADDPNALAAECDLVVVAVPPGSVVECILAALGASSSAVVTDVSSVKRTVVEDVLERAGERERERYVGGHPLAGDERGGIARARVDLFGGASWALCPARCSLASLATVVELVERLDARALVVEHDRHDAVVAWSSHLPHVLAAVLAGGAGPPDDDRPSAELVAALSGGSLRDATRVAVADPALWASILGANTDALDRAVEVATAAAAELTGALRAGDAPTVESILRAGGEGRERIARARWSPLSWEPARTPVVRWREALLAHGVAGHAVRRLVFEGEDLSYEVGVAEASPAASSSAGA